MMRLVIGLLIGLLCGTALVSAMDTYPRGAPVQVEWRIDDEAFIWFDCWPSDGQTTGEVWVYLVYQDGTAPYVCPQSTPYRFKPLPRPSDGRYQYVWEVH